MAKGRIEFSDDDSDDENEEFNDTSFDVEDFESSSQDLPPDPEEDFPEIDVQEASIDIPPVSNRAEDVAKEAKNDKTLAKEVEDEIKKLVKSAEKDAKQAIKEETRREKRELQDEARELRRTKHRDMREATQRRKEIRSQATQDKIATYSLASALGMQGYVVASIVDKFVYEPREDAAISKENTYQQDYQSYFESQEDSIIERRREIEDRASQKVELKLENEQEIRDSLMQSKKGGTVSNPPSPSIINNQNISVAPAPTSSPGQTTYTSPPGSTSSPPPSNPPTPGNAPPSNPPPPSSPPTPGGNGPPTPPSPTPPGTFDISNLVPIVYAIRYAADVVKQTTTGIGNASRQQIDAIGSEKGIEGVSKYAQSIGTAAGSVPIIGGVLEAQLAPFTESVKTFEAAVTTFEKFANKDLGFAPEALGESVNVKIEKLVQSMNIARETDSTKAEIIRATGRLDMAWAEFRRDVIVAWTPLLVATLENLKLCVGILRLAHKTLGLIYSVNQGALAWSVWFYQKFYGWLSKDNKNKGVVGQNVLDKIAAFHNQGGIVNGPAIKKRKMP
jgi:Skp family chaperone for outer membrane proteins